MCSKTALKLQLKLISLVGLNAGLKFTPDLFNVGAMLNYLTLVWLLFLCVLSVWFKMYSRSLSAWCRGVSGLGQWFIADWLTVAKILSKIGSRFDSECRKFIRLLGLDLGSTLDLAFVSRFI